jgi:hypothetical protein
MTNLKFTFAATENTEKFEIITPVLGAVKEEGLTSFELGTSAFTLAKSNFDFTEEEKSLEELEEAWDKSVPLNITRVILYVGSKGYQLEIMIDYLYPVTISGFTYCKASFDDWL